MKKGCENLVKDLFESTDQFEGLFLLKQISPLQLKRGILVVPKNEIRLKKTIEGKEEFPLVSHRTS